MLYPTKKMTYRFGRSEPLLPPILRRSTNHESSTLEVDNSIAYFKRAILWHICVAVNQLDKSFHHEAAMCIQRAIRTYLSDAMMTKMSSIKRNNLLLFKKNFDLEMSLNAEKEINKRLELKSQGLLRICLTEPLRRGRRTRTYSANTIKDLHVALNIISEVYDKKRHNLDVEERNLKLKLIKECIRMEDY